MFVNSDFRELLKNFNDNGVRYLIVSLLTRNWYL